MLNFVGVIKMQIIWICEWFVSLGFQTPGEKVFGPQKHNYLKHRTSGGIWKPSFFCRQEALDVDVFFF